MSKLELWQEQNILPSRTTTSANLHLIILTRIWNRIQSPLVNLQLDEPYSAIHIYEMDDCVAEADRYLAVEDFVHAGAQRLWEIFWAASADLKSMPLHVKGPKVSTLSSK